MSSLRGFATRSQLELATLTTMKTTICLLALGGADALTLGLRAAPRANVRMLFGGGGDGGEGGGLNMMETSALLLQ